MTANITALVPKAEAPAINRPCYQVYLHPITVEGMNLKAGVWYHGQILDKGTGGYTPFDEWLCGPLEIEAITRNEGKNGDYGRLLRFINADAQVLSWAMPNELLAGKPDSILSVLLGMGLDVDYQRRTKICQYIASQYPKDRVIAAVSTGWHSPNLFIMPRQNIGEGKAIFQSDTASGDEYRQGGTFDGWKAGIGARCAGNPVLMLSVCAALAGPLLYHLQRQGGGFHIVGDSSTGKSSAILASCSVWGHGENFKRTWRATGNGLEGVASQRNDTLLALDEIGEADPREIGAVIYAMANGVGKSRAGRNGAARLAKRWCLMLLSTGEMGLSAIMAEGGKRRRAGQEVRFLEIPVRRAFGAWDDLHGMSGGREFSDAIQHASVTHYGHAGPEFIRQLLNAGDLCELTSQLTQVCEKFPTASGQETRAAERFAILALAGELAIQFDILPVPAGSACAAMLELFSTWQSCRGEGPSEDRQILRSIADFIARHGDARFSSVADLHGEARDRAGYWEDTSDGRVYLFNRAGLEEAASGFDLTRIVLALDSVAAITKKDTGKHQASKRLLDGRSVRFYFIDSTKLDL